MKGLCDCNSFFASCERLFRPDLIGRPIVVLSNNDGCIVALSKEAKIQGITRGTPYHQVKETLDLMHCAVFSSNYTLYQDISDRVMDVLSQNVYNMKPYSIDESFFTLPEYMSPQKLRATMTQYTGIPVTIGIARTMTLCKVANYTGKHRADGTFVLKESDEKAILQKTPIEEIWGIGRKKSELLHHFGITTAYQLMEKDDLFIKKKLSITGLATVMELRGTPMISIEQNETKSCCSGISFSHPMTSREELEVAISCHAQTLSDKLINKGLSCQKIGLNIFTNRFQADFLSPYGTTVLDEPTDYTPTIISAAKQILAKIYCPGQYKGCRIWALDIQQNKGRQLDLFHSQSYARTMEKQDKISKVMDSINRKYGKGFVKSGAQMGKEKNDLMKRDYLSPFYTTQWKDIPKVILDE